MMRKAMGAVTGLSLFLIGTFLLVSFVRGAEGRAVADQRPVEVLVVSQPIGAGASPVVRTELVPQRLVMDEALLVNDSTEGLVATTDLVPGEQLLWSRLSAPEAVEDLLQPRVDVPPEFLTVTVPVAAERALGGLLLPGTRVAVVGSFQVEVEDARTGVITPTEATNILVHKALVVEVQSEEPPQQLALAESLVTQLPTGRVLVTLAVPAYDVERIVFAAEWGSIWFAQEGLQADTSGTRIQTPSSVFENPEKSEP